MTDLSTIESKIRKISSLPAIPSVVAEVLNITEDPSVQIEDVSVVLERDPALTGKILQISNSPYYGMKQYVSSLKLALVILGVREVRNIVLGVSVFELLNKESLSQRIVMELWNDSLRIGGIAKKLGNTLGSGLRGTEFIAGLLSDIGKIMLLDLHRTEYSELFKKHSGNNLQLCAVEEEQFGYHHGDIAALLAKNWNLPAELVDALWYQYPKEDSALDAAASPVLSAIVRIAKQAAQDDFEAEDGQASLSDEAAWAQLGDVRNPLPAASRQETLAEIWNDMKDAPKISL